MHSSYVVYSDNRVKFTVPGINPGIKNIKATIKKFYILLILEVPYGQKQKKVVFPVKLSINLSKENRFTDS